MAVKVKVETAAGETEYTVTAAEPTQPTTGSLELDLDNPKVTVSGLAGAAKVSLSLSFDGSDPATEDDTSEKLENGMVQLLAKAGNKVVFRGLNIPS